MPDILEVAPINEVGAGLYETPNSTKLYRRCDNYKIHDICNWMVEADEKESLCRSCRLTNTASDDLADKKKIKLWYNVEAAKRRLLYTLFKLDLPAVSKKVDPEQGLGFEFLADEIEDEYGNELFIKKYVTTGHSDGLITINLNEADPSSRIDMREKMKERYRTLLGHFRHESGHYYWNCLISNTKHIDECRELFGDERVSYQDSMKHYYANGPAHKWEKVWISAYASMHPWEDWAETWAHYMHMIDTLETANHFKFSLAGSTLDDPLLEPADDDPLTTEKHFTKLFSDWCKLTSSLNALNRSMGLDDAYPFVISMSALNKLRFVHRVIKEAAASVKFTPA